VIDEPIWKSVNWNVVVVVGGVLLTVGTVGVTVYFLGSRTKQVQVGVERAYEIVRAESVRHTNSMPLSRCFESHGARQSFMQPPPPKTVYGPSLAPNSEVIVMITLAQVGVLDRLSFRSAASPASVLPGSSYARLASAVQSTA